MHVEDCEWIIAKWRTILPAHFVRSLQKRVYLFVRLDEIISHKGN